MRHPGFARDDEEGAPEIDRLFDGGHGRGVGAVEDGQGRMSGRIAERLLEELGSEARSAHPQEHDVGDAFGADLVGEAAERVEPSGHGFGKAQPAQAVGYLRGRPLNPERRVARP
jgi:hypothetical protein